jgi:hypothetical protein
MVNQHQLGIQWSIGIIIVTVVRNVSEVVLAEFIDVLDKIDFFETFSETSKRKSF